MKHIACSMLASVVLLSACLTEKSTPPNPPPSAPAQPAATPPQKPIEPAQPVAQAQKPAEPSIVEVEKSVEPAKPAEALKPAPEPAKPVAETPKPVAETPKPATETAKPPVEAAKPPVETQKPPVETPKTPAKVDMDADIKVLMAKPEVADQNIEIQHILISFKGAPRMPATVTRSKEEAKALAEKVYAEVVGGADFLTLVKQHTNDSAPGIYPMTKAGRAGMVKGFGDVGFRLKVGEIGVAPWDASASPFGWHIIKRVK